jgi:hypothetical protein
MALSILVGGGIAVYSLCVMATGAVRIDELKTYFTRRPKNSAAIEGESEDI